MNYFIFDTEQTYNYGYIIINDKGEVLLKENLILTNNFENRKLIGENTYKRKKPIFEKDPYAKFVGSAEGANIILDRFNSYNIEYIISHNINEDRRQLELLSQQTGVNFPGIPFYDSINLVKVLFPNNTQTGLESIISDITGIDIKQTHTALQDCELLLNLIGNIVEYIPYFINYQEIFAHDSDYEITYKFFMNFDNILPFPKNVKEIHKILNMDGNAGSKKIVNNFIKRISTTYNFWNVENCIEYSEKTGKALKTPGLELTINENNNKDVEIIAKLFKSLPEISNYVVSACVKYQSIQETDETILERLNIYKATLEAEYTERERNLAERERKFFVDCAERKATLEAEYAERERKFFVDCAERKATLEAEYAERERNIKNTVANLIMKKIKPIVNGGIFNNELKMIKGYIKENNEKALYDYFLN